MHTYTYLGVCLLLLVLSPSLTSGDDDLDPLAKKFGSKFASFRPPPGDAGALATKRIKCVRGLDGTDHVYKCPKSLKSEDGSVLCDVGACYFMQSSRKDDIERGCYCAPNPDLMDKCVTLKGADPDGYDLRMCWCSANELGCCNKEEASTADGYYYKNETEYPKTKEDNCRHFDDYDEAKKGGGNGGSTTKKMYDNDHDGRGSEFDEGHSFQPSAKSIFLGLISLVLLKALFYQA